MNGYIKDWLTRQVRSYNSHKIPQDTVYTYIRNTTGVRQYSTSLESKIFYKIEHTLFEGEFFLTLSARNIGHGVMELFTLHECGGASLL